jgi:hypothetical protein
VSRPHPYRSDEQTKGMRILRSKPDSADRSVTATTPCATSPDDVLGTASGGLTPRTANRTRSVCRCQSIVRARCAWRATASRNDPQHQFDPQNPHPLCCFLSCEGGPTRTASCGLLRTGANRSFASLRMTLTARLAEERVSGVSAVSAVSAATLVKELSRNSAMNLK